MKEQEVNNVMKTMDKDEKLVEAFFRTHHEEIADNGFSERVMAAIAQLHTQAAMVSRETVRLKRWSLWLNIVAGIGTLALLLRYDLWGHLWRWIQMFDSDDLLVAVMLFLHQLTKLMPSTTQLLTIALTTVILMTLVIRRVVDGAGRGYIP